MKVLTLTLKETKALLGTVTGWMVLAAFMAIFGALWILHVTVYVTYSEELTGGQGTEILRIGDNIVTPLYSSMVLIFVFLCPAISMRLFASEYKENTMELLLTAPLSTAELVLGKFLGAMGFVTLLLLTTLYAPAFLLWWHPHDIAPYLGSYVGLWCLSAGLIAMGMWFSSFSSSQIAALIPAFAMGMGLYLLGFAGLASHGWTAQLALGTHIDGFFRGVLVVTDMSYFGLMTGLFQLATHQRIESIRWH